jgi:hypothetical protein
MQYEIQFKATYTVEVIAPNQEEAQKVGYARVHDWAEQCVDGSDFSIESMVEVDNG